MFLDEPTTGLDPAARRSLWDLVRGLKADGRSVLLTTHYMEEAEILCDRLAIMDHGRILEMGTVDELVTRHFQERAVRFDRVDGLDDGRARGAAGRLVASKEDARRDAAVHERRRPRRSVRCLRWPTAAASSRSNLAIRRATLEDVFLDLTGRALRDWADGCEPCGR